MTERPVGGVAMLEQGLATVIEEVFSRAWISQDQRHLANWVAISQKDVRAPFPIKIDIK